MSAVFDGLPYPPAQFISNQGVGFSLKIGDQIVVELRWDSDWSGFDLELSRRVGQLFADDDILMRRIVFVPFDTCVKEVLGELSELRTRVRGIAERGARAEVLQGLALRASPDALSETPQQQGGFDPFRAAVGVHFVQYEELPETRMFSVEENAIVRSQEQVFEHRVVGD